MYVEPPLYPWNENNLFTVYYLLNVLLSLVYKYLIEIFCVWSLKRLVYNSLLLVSLFSFGRGEFGSILSPYIFWKSLRNIDISFSLKVW
jgi:hypothetical protein